MHGDLKMRLELGDWGWIGNGAQGGKKGKQIREGAGLGVHRNSHMRLPVVSPGQRSQPGWQVSITRGLYDPAARQASEPLGLRAGHQ